LNAHKLRGKAAIGTGWIFSKYSFVAQSYSLPTLSFYGADNQHYHVDVGRITSASAYARNAVPSYSLFIPLQNTTKEMGSTGICPGTHSCGFGAELSCRENGFQVFEDTGMWPTGYGFLYNTAMVHRGSAHTDRNGPDRVVFMLTFSSRPRYGKNILETRYISDHFFNHWLTWGHTASDFAQPAKYMSQPWQALRTLGIYKWPHRKWGWDYLTVLLLFIGNMGYEGSRDGNLNLFVKNTWLSRFAAFLQVNTQTLKGSMTQKWLQYFDELSVKFREVLLAVYLVLFCLCSLIFGLIHGKSAIRRNFVRLFLFHGIVLGVAWLSFQRVSTSTWAKSIRSGRLYRTPLKSRGPELPSTLPLVDDVLTPDDYQSEYLDSFNRILEYGHAGNKHWNDLLKGYSLGYNGLEPNLQEQLSSSAIKWARQQKIRILTKNHLNQWAQLDEDRARRFAHKELMKASNQFVAHAVRWTEFLLSETKYGFWRDTSMHISAIPSLLRELQSKLLRFPGEKASKVPVIRACASVDLASGNSLLIHSSLPVLPKKREAAAVSSERSNVAPELSIVEPYPGAWINVGDVVEAKYRQNRDGT